MAFPVKKKTDANKKTKKLTVKNLHFFLVNQKKNQVKKQESR